MSKAKQVTVQAQVNGEIVFDKTIEGSLPEGWTEAYPGGMATNRDPVRGGIIHDEIVSGLWFVIFHRDDLPILDGFSSRDEAIRAYQQAISQGDKTQ